MAAGPVSRILSAVTGGTVIPLRRTLLYACSDLPGTFTHCWGPEGLARRAGTHRNYSRIRPLFGLAPCGVCHAPVITDGPVRSYRTFSPLPSSCEERRYRLCGTFRPAALTPPSRTLSGTLLCGVRTFLRARRAHPATVRSDCQLPHYSRSVYGSLRRFSGAGRRCRARPGHVRNCDGLVGPSCWLPRRPLRC